VQKDGMFVVGGQLFMYVLPTPMLKSFSKKYLRDNIIEGVK